MTTVYIDESKSNGYTIVAAMVLTGDETELRKAINKLRMKGQRRIHFTKESDPRRRVILSEFERLQIRARIYHVAGHSEQEARELILAQIVADIEELGITRIVLERDASIEEQDRRTLYQELEARGLRDKVTYVHDTAVGEILLCLTRSPGVMPRAGTGSDA